MEFFQCEQISQDRSSGENRQRKDAEQCATISFAELVVRTAAADRVAIAESPGSGRQRLPARKTRIQFVPIQDLRLVELPAQIRLAAIDQRGEIDQPFRPFFGSTPSLVSSSTYSRSRRPSFSNSSSIWTSSSL